MIAGNELRKGNLVQYNSIVGKVTQIFWNRIEVEVTVNNEKAFNEWRYEDLEPIAVTLDILEKCDLVKHRRFYYANVFYSKKGKLTINQLRDNIEVSFAVNSTPGIISDQNLTVHQFQNLYFALLQDELVINL